ncbi:hypothetical protein Y032_0252g239 [Ancylostoma ceylanicum]|uniref:Uncharacterized protein n=1 Tax=Ancylostoma ceylanicum TaxID=53326 RepID=A0A016SBU9_9BILA|nr:hypothetical protein Y032_0252g239 [Ancylostoma ceylanicum]
MYAKVLANKCSYELEIKNYALKYYVQCIRNDESAQAAHVTAKSLVDIIKITMKCDTQIGNEDVECWQAWPPRPPERTSRFG